MRLGAQLLICAVVAVVPAFAVGAMTLDHNPQGEFASPGYTSDFYTLVGIAWAFLALPSMALLTLIEFGRRADH